MTLEFALLIKHIREHKNTLKNKCDHTWLVNLDCYYTEIFWYEEVEASLFNNSILNI